MPELPEVETVVRDLRAAGLVGRHISRARVYWPRTVSGTSPAAFTRQVTGRTITGLGRRGKFIVVRLSGPRDLLIHLRMTGQMALPQPGTPRGRHEHVVFLLDDGRELRFRDTRKFGRWMLIENVSTVLDRLGPEPLDPGFSGRDFARRLAARRAMLKPLLLNQAFVAGLGNIYVDEALWEARLHPRRNSATLTPRQRQQLYRAIRRVLRRGIAAMGTTLGSGAANFYSVSGRRGRNQDKLRVFRRTGQACPRCRGPIERIIVGQRSTHICAACQE